MSISNAEYMHTAEYIMYGNLDNSIRLLLLFEYRYFQLIALELCDDGFRPVLANSMFVYELISNEISAIELPKNSLTSYDIFIIFVVVEVENASKQYLR